MLCLTSPRICSTTIKSGIGSASGSTGHLLLNQLFVRYHFHKNDNIYHLHLDGYRITFSRSWVKHIIRVQAANCPSDTIQ